MVKNKNFKRYLIFLEIGLVTLILCILDFIFYFDVNEKMELVVDFVFAEFIFFYIFLCTVCILISIVRQKSKKFILFGIVGSIGGILSFFAASLMYAAANMSFFGLLHLLVIYLSPILAFIGLIILLASFVYKLIQSRKFHKKQ
ncbi:MAG: hypothetical protein FJZ09_04335 [Candidatus Omnitrophica bacterium]|nr:hypothetical protein [Candidatus Omnitrophota bacterium]